MRCLTAIEDRLAATRTTLDLSIDAADGAGISWLHRNAEVLNKELHDGRFDMTVRVDETKRDIVVRGSTPCRTWREHQSSREQRDARAGIEVPLNSSASPPRALGRADDAAAPSPSPRSTARPSRRATRPRANGPWPPARARYRRSGARIWRWCRAAPFRIGADMPRQIDQREQQIAGFLREFVARRRDRARPRSRRLPRGSCAAPRGDRSSRSRRWRPCAAIPSRASAPAGRP